MTQSQDALLGNVIGNCRLETRLAAGGMGVVYRAHSKRLDCEVAMKILAPSLATDPEYVERFFREAKAAASIDHPNVVKVLDSGMDQNRYFMVMEYVRGRTLADLIGEKGRLNLEMSTRLVRDIARGLEVAHKAGLVHRDIKPANILLTHDLVPKITDFGLVRLGSRPSGITLEGVFMGTPEYVSPEQAEGRKIDARSDLYSLGVTYYQLLSGAFPFYGKTAMEMALARLRDEPRPIEHALPGVDPRAAAVVKKLLRKNPSERYASATDLIRDLEALLTNRPATAGPTTKKNTRRMSLLSLDAKRTMRLLSFSILYLAAAACFAGVGLAVGPRGTPRLDFARIGFRELCAGGGVLAFAGALFVFRRELSACGRWFRLVFLLVLALAAVAVGTAGANAGTDPGPAARAIAAAVSGRAHAMLGALALTILAVGLAWTKPPGEYRYIVFRLLLVGSLALLYGFAVGRDLAGPFRHFRDSMDVLLPLLTGTVVAAMFGIELAVGHRWQGGARLLGVFLLAGSMAGVVAFGTLGLHDLENRVDWGRVLSAPFVREGKAFYSRAGGLGAAAVLVCLAWVQYLAGLERGARKKI